MGGSGGNVPDIQEQTPGQLKPWYKTQFNQFGQFRENDPFLGPAGQGALNYYNQTLPGAMAQFPGFGKELEGAQGKLGNIYGQLGQTRGQLGGLIPQLSGYQQQGQGLFGKLGGLSSRLGGIYGAPGGPGGIIASGGALTGGLLRNARQQSLTDQAQAGIAHTVPGLANTVLNEESARAARLAGAQQVGQQLTQGQAGIAGQQGGILGLLGQLTGQKAGIYGQQAGVSGLQQGNVAQGAALTGQKANLLGQQQSLLGQSLAQLLGVGGAGVSQFMGLTSPVWGALAGNQQASAQQAQLQAQAGAQSGQGIGDLIGSIAQIAGPILMAAFSDKRLKTKIKDTGMRTPDGIPIKTFEYKTRPGVPLLGVIAQDVLRKRPDAVLTDRLSGIKSVNLWKLGAPMAELKGG